MLALLLVSMAGAVALFAALALRLPSLTSTLLAAYVAFVANLGGVTLALSPFEAVTRAGLAIAEAILLAAALGAWWLRGRPRPPLEGARAAAREIVRDPVTVLLLAFVLVLLAYEALLATSPPNNMDSLTYHLARAAAWAQHDGIHWIVNSPDVRLTMFQPLAEQQILYLFVAAGDGVLYALPQYLAQLAVLVAVYGAARRLGFAVRPSACAALLTATFSNVALESFTAQNDLFAASLVAVASCLILSGGRLEPALGGFAAGLGLGAKLTVGLTVPILFFLALAQGRRSLLAGIAGGLVGFVAIGMWGFVMNYDHTGDPLGSQAASDLQQRASPSYPESVSYGFYLMYGLMDGSILSSRLIHVLAYVGLGVAIAAAAWLLYRRRSAARALADGAATGLPFAAPLLVIGGAAVVAFVADKWGFPIRGAGGRMAPVEEILNLEYGRIANENYSAFGPVCVVALLVATGLTVYDVARRRADLRHLALACALPLFVALVAMTTYWSPFLIRYTVIPAAIATPLLARLFRNRVTTAAWAAAAGIAIALTVTHDLPKPLSNPYGLGRPWNLSQRDALFTNSYGYVGDAQREFEKRVPPRACVGAMFDVNDPAYLLYGPDHGRKVYFLNLDTAVNDALSRGLWYVVVTTGEHGYMADVFAEAGWTITPLAGFWQLATYGNGGEGTC